MLLRFFYHIFLYDIWFYISHITLHQRELYKKIHNYHHQIVYNNLNYKDAYKSHFLEDIIQSSGILLPFFSSVQYTPLILSSLFAIIRGFLRHDIRYVWLVGNHHLLHHKYPKYNFGEWWIDTLLHTKYPDPDNEYKPGLIYL